MYYPIATKTNEILQGLFVILWGFEMAVLIVSAWGGIFFIAPTYTPSREITACILWFTSSVWVIGRQEIRTQFFDPETPPSSKFLIAQMLWTTQFCISQMLLLPCWYWIFIQSGAVSIVEGKLWLYGIILLQGFQFFASLLTAFRYLVGESFGRRVWLETFEKGWSPQTHRPAWWAFCRRLDRLRYQTWSLKSVTSLHPLERSISALQGGVIAFWLRVIMVLSLVVGVGIMGILTILIVVMFFALLSPLLFMKVLYALCLDHREGGDVQFVR